MGSILKLSKFGLASPLELRTSHTILTQPIHYPFGMGMQGRSFSIQGKYRYGFNGKEKDSEIASDNYDFGARIYDGRIGRWLAVDPLFKKYSSLSPYSSVFNCPLFFIDHDGRDIITPKAKVSNTGPVVPKCMGEVARMEVKYDFIFNDNGCVNFEIVTEIIYSASIEEIIKENGENLRGFMRIHEEEHVLRYHEAGHFIYKYETELFGNVVNYEGKLDEIATKLNQEEFLPRIEKLRKEKYQALDDSQREFDKLHENSDKLSNEYKSALAEYRLKREEINSDFEKKIEEVNQERKRVCQDLRNLYKKKSDELNEHEGRNGVIAVSLSKMTKEEAKYNRNGINVNDFNLPNCPPESDDH